MKIIKPINMTDSMLTSTTVPESDYAVWSATTSYVAGARCIILAKHMIYEAVSGKTSAVTISAASPAVIGWIYHGLPEATPITFTNSGGALPTGLATGTVYYVKTPLADSFNLAATPGGAAINTTGGSGTHTAHTNRGISPDTDILSANPRWIKFSATNRWKAFDKKLGDQVRQTTSMQYVITPGTMVEAVSFHNIDATTFDMTYVVGDLTFTKSESMISTKEIIDALTYFYNPFLVKTELAYTDLPLGNGGVLTVTLAKAAGETVGLGEIVFGRVKTIGLSQYGATLSFQDLSKKDRDTYGNFDILERGYYDRMSIDVWLPPTYVDILRRLLVEIRATPVVWIGADDPVLGSPTYGDSMFASMVVYGFFSNFKIIMQDSGSSGCSLEIEGLA